MSLELQNLPSQIHEPQRLRSINRSETDISTDNDTPESEDEEPNIPEGGLQAYLVLLGSFLGLTGHFGLLNSVGAIQTYVATHQLSDLSSSTISWIFSIYLAIAFSGTVVVGPLFDAKGALTPMVLGNILVLLGIMTSAHCTEVYQFILSLSICVGFGNALCISPLIGVVSHWFYRNIGFAIGISSIGGSVGGMIIPIMLRNLYAKVGFTWAMRVLALFCCSLSIIATFLIKERFKKNNKEQNNKMFDFRALKDSKFVLLVIGVLFGETCLLSVATYYGTYAIAQGFSESSSYILLTIFNGTGILGRACPGWLSDRIGHFNVMIMMLICTSISVLVLWVPFGSHTGVIYTFIALFGFFSALIFSLTPACLRQITPVREFGSRYGLMYFFVSFGNLIGIPIGSVIIGDLSKFHYEMFSLFCGLVALASSISWVISRYRIVGLRLNVKI